MSTQILSHIIQTYTLLNLSKETTTELVNGSRSVQRAEIESLKHRKRGCHKAQNLAKRLVMQYKNIRALTEHGLS